MERFLKIPHQTFVRLTHLAQKRNCLAVIPVYLALLYHADTHGRCFPGYKRIQEIAGVKGDATVSKALRILEEEGLILVSRSHGIHGANRYILQTSIIEVKTSMNEVKTSMNEALNFNDCSPKLQSLKCQTSMNEDELDPINYNQYNYTQLTKGEGREKNGRYRKFGPPENPEDDWKYYGFSR